MRSGRGGRGGGRGAGRGGREEPRGRRDDGRSRRGDAPRRGDGPRGGDARRGEGPRGGREGRGPGPDADVDKIHGAHAVAAVLQNRPDAVVRAYIDESRRSAFNELMRDLAERRVAYRLVPPEELDRVASTRHHEGICVLVKPRPQPTLEAWIAACPPAACALVLDGVDNPHNIGAIIRSAAHFGATGVWVVGRASLRGAVARVAEGGAEAVELFSVPSAAPVLLGLARAGFEVVGSSARAERTLFEQRLPRRTCFVLGSEREGLSEATTGLLETELAIPGTGGVESLNVSCAAAVLLAEYRRQRLSAAERRGGSRADAPADES